MKGGSSAEMKMAKKKRGKEFELKQVKKEGVQAMAVKRINAWIPEIRKGRAINKRTGVLGREGYLPGN